jgi:hypothetical protein
MAMGREGKGNKSEKYLPNLRPHEQVLQLLNYFFIPFSKYLHGLINSCNLPININMHHHQQQQQQTAHLTHSHISNLAQPPPT